MLRFEPGDALLVVDFQNDFCEGGALEVPHASEILPAVNALVEAASRSRTPIVYSRDWHPRNHVSFRERGGRWPPHCVQGSRGAELHPALRVAEGAIHLDKADDPDLDLYSPFDRTNLADRLRALRVRRVVVCGLAEDYCVREAVLDALREGFQAILVADATRPVDVRPGDGALAREEMRRAGARVAQLEARA